MVRALLLAALTASTPWVSGAGAPPSFTPPAAVAPAPAWRWPLAPRPAVVRPFHAPPTTWGAGHRGVDLAGRVGQPVLSAGAGQVTFVGRVAGRGVVVISHPDGSRTTYEPVRATVPMGSAVPAGAPLGRLTAEHGHCAEVSCLHWGLRRGRQYLDPLTLLGAGPVVLLPHEGLPHEGLPHDGVSGRAVGCRWADPRCRTGGQPAVTSVILPRS